jgi:hypothetical protein
VGPILDKGLLAISSSSLRFSVLSIYREPAALFLVING